MTILEFKEIGAGDNDCRPSGRREVKKLHNDQVTGDNKTETSTANKKVDNNESGELQNMGFI